MLPLRKPEPAAYEADSRASTIEAYLPLARGYARRIARSMRSEDANELYSDGVVGVIRAVDTFDPVRGLPLENYVKKLVLGSIFNGIRKRSTVSSRVRKTMRHIEDQRYAIAQQRGTLPTLGEMERRDERFRTVRLQAYRQQNVSLDAPLPAGERFAADGAQNPELVAVQKMLLEKVLAAVDQLPGRQRYVLHAHYFGGEPINEIAKGMNLTPQRVSQIHMKSLATLRGIFAR